MTKQFKKAVKKQKKNHAATFEWGEKTKTLTLTCPKSDWYIKSLKITCSCWGKFL